MIITCLGTGSPEPSLKRASSGYLVEVENKNILIDCGGGVFGRLLEAGLFPHQITHVIFSHLHSDHMLDYPRLIHAIWDGNNTLPKKSRMDLFKDFTRYKNENGQKAIEEYYKISKKYNIDFTQMSLKFCEIQPFMTSVIIGATSMEQLKTNIESVNVTLSNEIINEINQIQKKYPNPCP